MVEVPTSSPHAQTSCAETPRPGAGRHVLVVGAGAAGIPAALAALEAGARVTLVDKGQRAGGMLWGSGAVLSAAGTDLQRTRGIVDSPLRHAQEVWRAGRHRAVPELLALATTHAAESLAWVQSLGARFTAESPLLLGLADQHELYGVARSYLLEAPEELGWRRGPVLAEVLVGALAPWSASRQLDLRLRSTVTRLLVAGDGTVSGCRVEAAGGSTTDVSADCVVLATGGYGASPQWLRSLHGEYDQLVTQGLAHATGDGLVLGEQVGGGVVNADIVVPSMGALEDPDHPGFRLAEGALPVGRPPAVAGDIWVNAAGVRFVAEDTESPDVRERAILDQPGGRMVAVFDERMRRGLTPAVADWTGRVLGDPPDPRLVHSADTLPELAALAGLPADALVESVRSYGQAVTRRADPLGRSRMPTALTVPPFHAVPTVSSLVVTFAGLGVDGGLRVVRPDGRPVGGLLAVGELLGGGQVQGDGFSSGMSVTPALTLGRIAGRTAAGVDPRGLDRRPHEVAADLVGAAGGAAPGGTAPGAPGGGAA